MRPVNLIPPEDRRGDRAPLRTGSLSYFVLAGLALALAAIVAVVLTGNSIDERKAEIVDLEARETAAKVEAQSLGAFAEFASTAETRAMTVSSLAQSRFDWERVLRELALVIPEEVWLVELSGVASPDVALDNAAEIGLETNASGPSLAMVGCATGHETVAQFLQALRDIDGVTRVGIAKSELNLEQDSGAGTGGTDCRTRDFISRFEIVATFDEATVPEISSGAAPTAPAAPAPTATADDGVAR